MQRRAKKRIKLETRYDQQADVESHSASLTDRMRKQNFGFGKDPSCSVKSVQ